MARAFTSAIALAKHQQARSAAAVHAQDRGHKYLAESGEDDFRDLTQGPLKQKQLNAMGNPYAWAGKAQRGGKAGFKSSLKGQITRKGFVSRLPINKQSGKLYQAIFLDGPSGAMKEYRLGSIAPHAKYVLNPKGTSLMVPRGLLGPSGELRKRHKARKQVMIHELRTAHRSV